MNNDRTLPLRITSVDGAPSVRLGEIELSSVLARDGVEIRSVDPSPRTYSGPSVPEVILTFGPGALALDFDIDLLETLLASAKAAQA